MLLVDAFTDRAFAGNPAAVCLLQAEADIDWMQNLAMEMNQAETAFVRPAPGGFELRWFTPSCEVDLCGHATLASAHALWSTQRLPEHEPARFHTRSGVLVATKEAQIRLDFPSEPPSTASLPHDIAGLSPVWTGKNRFDWVVELQSEAELRDFVPDFPCIAELGMRGLQVTTRGQGQIDFVSRFFAPQSGVPEDAVTGSAHCSLGPYWAGKLRKTTLRGYQASRRGGYVSVEVLGDRVALRGDAVTVLEGLVQC